MSIGWKRTYDINQRPKDKSVQGESGERDPSPRSPHHKSGGKHDDLVEPPDGTDPARRQGYLKVETHPATDLLGYSARGSLEAKYILIEHDVRNQETDSDGRVIHCAGPFEISDRRMHYVPAPEPRKHGTTRPRRHQGRALAQGREQPDRGGLRRAGPVHAPPPAGRCLGGLSPGRWQGGRRGGGAHPSPDRNGRAVKISIPLH